MDVVRQQVKQQGNMFIYVGNNFYPILMNMNVIKGLYRRK
jgi:hypothetical protein